MKRGYLPLVFLVAVVLAGCGSSHRASVSAGHGPSPSAVSTTTPAALQASDTIKNGVMTLTVGQVLTVTLHSTYWQFAGPSDPSVLGPMGGPESQVCANPPSFPGSGCGTVVQRFRALHAGMAVLTASRNACGEAMGCRPDQSHWQLTVPVH